MPYALMLAQGETKSMLSIYILLIILVVPLMTILSIEYGAIGGALAQLILFILYVFIGTLITHKRYFKGYARAWLLIDIGVPLGISIIAGLFGYLIIQVLEDAVYEKLVAGVALWFIAAILCIYASKYSRSLFLGYLNQFNFR
jgi:O-antigen/teichoic acid export membrane protein